MDTAARNALILSQTRLLLEKGKLRSTTARVKATTQFVDSLLARLASTDEENALKYFEKNLRDKKFAEKIVKRLKPQLTERKSGFISVLKIENRKGDNSSMSIARLILPEKKEKTGKIIKRKTINKKVTKTSKKK